MDVRCISETHVSKVVDVEWISHLTGPFASPSQDTAQLLHRKLEHGVWLTSKLDNKPRRKYVQFATLSQATVRSRAEDDPIG